MNMKTIAAFLFVIGFATSVCLASEELPLPLASADVRGWTKIAGGVRIQIESPEIGIESVRITAFGRDIKIPDEEFAKLKGVMYSDVSITHEGGYKELGGHTIYFTLRISGLYEGDPFKGAPMLEQRVRISVPEKAPVSVTKERIKVEGEPAPKR